ncbi:histidine kinase [Paenibacillus yonginensis]|uniref:histidine kinase n=1 Tax=Paenibacillus yonginensis TaxID=1462996 RepID=A0A1B1N3T0_9BACL|nr:HAMP domain-containing sensor histidine kinase [Paenibacillus yonginensis]ANS76069.1 histidine kinase [Paenibacillus yonginensis]
MKLVHQINLAFGLLLVVVLGATAIIIHFVLLDHLIDAQKQDMRTLSASVAGNIQNQASLTPVTKPGTLEGTYQPDPALPVPSVPLAAGVQAIVADNDGHVLSGTLPGPSAPLQTQTEGASSAAAYPAEPMLINSEKLQALQAGKDSSYLVDVSPLPQGTLTLVAPVSKVNALERTLFVRLLIVLGVGVGLVLLLSLVITRQLIRPLMELREELKKVKDRRFSDVSRVRAGGEIGAVAKVVYELAVELDRYIRVQKHFFQNASHELKTPLMSIAGYTEGIRDGVFEGEEMRKGLDIILSESGRLTRIVSEMTLLAKLDSEEDIFHPAPVRIEELLEETAERINPMLVSKGLQLEVAYGKGENGPLEVWADRDKLLQALLNVTLNAARYANGKIAIGVEREENSLVVAVSDDGQGIPEELLPHLFHRFVKGRKGENGLGLAISRAIIERCGGQITAGNRPEGGAVFTFRFPIC